MGDVRPKQLTTKPPWGARHPKYINREWSWLQFNARVLHEAESETHPLLERLRFLAIFESNLDEFYMVRVSGLIEQFEGGVLDVTPDGLTAEDQLTLIAETAQPLRQRASQLWESELKKKLAFQGISVLDYDQVAGSAQSQLEQFFLRAVFPLCTPLMMEPTITFPFISNRSLNLAVELRDGGETRLARLKIPPVIPRLVPVPGMENSFVLLEDLIGAHLGYLFPGVEVAGAHAFRVIRDADIEIRELEAADLISAVEQSLRLRRFGDPVLLEVSQALAPQWVEVLRRGLHLDESDVFTVNGLVGLEVLYEIANLPRPDLKFSHHTPFCAEPLRETAGIFETIRHRDVLLHHPYDSFETVERFVGSAVDDPNVVGIKQTLYRVGSESPIVESLLAAGEAGKQVAAMVELKARFDESNNLVWSRALERVGVHVTYGIADMKVHCKLCLVVRSEDGELRTYVHIGTGNYNPSTARVYTDIGLLTCDPEIAQDVTELFNFLTGFSKQADYRQLLVAPVNLREGIIARIERETEFAKAGRPAWIKFKLNSLVDPEVIDALYEASEAGVKVDLVVRGICCLRPNQKTLSQNIRVVSIVGRFLEHSRIYSFANDGESEVFIGSADMMRRNLDRRVEALVPVRDKAQKAYLIGTVIDTYLKDNQNAWLLDAKGSYELLQPSGGQKAIQSQQMLMKASAGEKLMALKKPRNEAAGGRSRNSRALPRVTG